MSIVQKWKLLARRTHDISQSWLQLWAHDVFSGVQIQLPWRKSDRSLPDVYDAFLICISTAKRLFFKHFLPSQTNEGTKSESQRDRSFDKCGLHLDAAPIVDGEV